MKTVLEQQNAIEHVPAACVRRKGCDRGHEPLGSEVQRESLWVSMSDLAFWKVGFKGVLGERFFLVEGGASRETQSGGEAWPDVARVIRQTIDCDTPPDSCYLS